MSKSLDHGYHPEIDETALIDDDRANYYQSMIGILLWASELGHIDITQVVSMMVRSGAIPREGQSKCFKFFLSEKASEVLTRVQH